MLGRLAQASLPQGGSSSLHKDIGHGLLRWVTQLPVELRLSTAQDYNFEVRQLHLPYFSAVSILYGTGPSPRVCSAAAALASSCVARIFEDFLPRGDLRYLSPITSLYLLIAAIPQLSCYKFPALLELSKSEINIVHLSLVEMGKRWHGARRLERFVGRIRSEVEHGAVDQTGKLDIRPEHFAYFETLEEELCPKGRLIVSGDYAKIPHSLSADSLGMVTPSSRSLTSYPTASTAALRQETGICTPPHTVTVGPMEGVDSQRGQPANGFIFETNLMLSSTEPGYEDENGWFESDSGPMWHLRESDFV